LERPPPDDVCEGRVRNFPHEQKRQVLYDSEPICVFRLSHAASARARHAGTTIVVRELAPFEGGPVIVVAENLIRSPRRSP
jgi:hypothetical protein